MRRPIRGRPGKGRAAARAAALLLAATLAVPAGAGATDKISGEILAHRAQKRRPPGLDEAEHVRRLVELGLDPALRDAERCAIYTEGRLADTELDELQRHGIRVSRELWVPPVPGRHPHGFHLATVPYSQLDRLRAHPAVVRVESTEFVARPLNNLTRRRINVDDVHAGNGVTPRDGAGVKLAVADSGLDVDHPDIPVLAEGFDVTDGDGPATWGTDVRNRAIGHGTHVTGAAVASGALSAGNTGNGGDDYAGAAPGVALHFYKIGNDFTGSTTFDDMIEAIDRAAAVGCRVFTMSYGGFSSTYLDGSSSVCQAIDSAVAGGMAVFISAGNEAHLRHHASARAPAGGSSAEFFFEIANAGGETPLVGATTFRVVWKDGDPLDANVTLEILNLGVGESLDEFPAGASVRGTESKRYLLNYVVPPGENHRYRMRFANAAASGATPEAHVMRIGGGGLFDPDTSRATTIVHPGLCDGAIAVGAWTQRDGWTNYLNEAWDCCNLTEDTLGEFSSRGPRVDGHRKPDLVAPGATTISTKDALYHNLETRKIDNDGVGLDGSGPADYYALHGTSQAAPVAAGVAALLLEAAPGLAPSGVRNALTGTASRAASPDDEVGYGLIDALAAVQGLPAAGSDADGDWHAAPGDCDDADPRIWVTPGEVPRLRFVDRWTIEWSPAVEPGASSVVYDVLSSFRPDSFSGASCVEAGDGSDHTAFDGFSPSAGQAAYYLVRAVNGCPSGHGTLGSGSDGTGRVGRTCE